LNLLPSVREAWQPSEILPLNLANSSNESCQLVESCRAVSRETIVVLAGNAITEEALPSYSSALRRVEVLHDMRGDSVSPWMQWVRAWTAEENRHGEILTRFLLLSGRVNGSGLERTTHALIRNGFDTADDGDPIRTFVYTAFQERATKVCHINVSCLAEREGVSLLAKICRLIAADETRHEEVYTRFMTEIFRLDANEAVIAYSDMMRSRITMPARLMGEEGGVDLFEQFSLIAEDLGVYTSEDYISIIEHLNSRWQIANLKGLSSAAAEQQGYLCELPHRTRRAVSRRKVRQITRASQAFDWVFP
jgi:acyl-[acyl-carrier-protein] desaturase